MRSTVFALVALFTTAAHATPTMEVSVVTDWQTVQYFGSVENADKALRSTVDYAATIYRNQLGIELKLTYVDVPTSKDSDAIAGHTQPLFLIDEIELYRSNNPAHRNADVTVFMSVRNLSMSNKQYAGYANMTAICSSLAVALVRLQNNGLDGQNLAHEVAHVLGAEHDGEGACVTETGGYLMSPVQSGNEFFSQCTINTIKTVLATRVDCMPDSAPVATPPTTQPALAQESSGGGGSMEWLSIALLALLAFRRTRN